MKLLTKRLFFSTLFLSALCISGLALAKWVGQYYCGPSCSFDKPLLDGDGYMFIFSDVNVDVEKWTDSQGNPNTVTLCNGTECALYRYIALSGQWLLINKFFSTWVGSTIRPDGGGAGGSEMCGGGSFGGTTSGWGVTGYKPIYRTATTSTPGGSSSQQVLVGYEPTYGMVQQDASILVC